MTVGELCTRAVRTVPPDASIGEAARRMRRHDVGCLVVVDGVDPLDGIVTDRDLVLRGLASERDPSTTAVREVMTRGPAAVEAGVGAEQALHLMADQGVRRLVVLDSEGALLGVVSYDDVLSFLVEELDQVGRLLRPKARI